MPLSRAPCVYGRWSLLLMLLLGCGPAAGHLLNMSRLTIELQPASSPGEPSAATVTAVLELDLTRALGGAAAFHQASLEPRPLEVPALRQLCDRVGAALLLEIEGQRVSWRPTALSFSSRSLEDYESNLVWPRATLQLEGALPAVAAEPSAAAGATGAAATSGAFSLRLASSFPFEEPIATTLRTLARTADKPVSMTRWLVVDQRFPALRPALRTALGGYDYARVARSQVPETERPARRSVLIAFLWLGVTHVLPGGWDHLAFVFGLLLLATSVRSTIVLLSVYTLGHTLSYLALALRWIPAPGPWAELLILGSLFWVGASLWRRPVGSAGQSSRSALVGVTGFGLVHGLGFASSLSALPTEPAQLLSSIIGFNLGIELAQLTVALVAGLLLLLPVRGQPAKQRYRRVFSAILMSLPVLVFLAGW